MDSTNYQQWSAAMQSFMSQGQWGCTSKEGAPPTVVLELDASDKWTGKFTEGAADYKAWLKDREKALGNIRLHLHHNIGYQYNEVNNPYDLWKTLKGKYGKVGVTSAFVEFKGAMETAIPNGSDPSPALDKIITHFVRLEAQGWETPSKVQGMKLLSKAPSNMESVVQVYAQMIKDQPEEDGNLDPLKISAAMRTSWETHGRFGAGKKNQQQANKLSAVKPAQGQPPQFQQQRGNEGGNRGGRGKGRRGKRGSGVNKNAQLMQQDSAPPVQVQFVDPNQPGPSNQTYQWVPAPQQPPANYGNPYSSPPTNNLPPPNMSFFASRITAGRPLPPVPQLQSASGKWPTFNKAMTLASRLGLPTTMETIRTLEMAEMAKERLTPHEREPPKDPRPSKRAKKQLPRGVVQGEEDQVSLGYTSEDEVVDREMADPHFEECHDIDPDFGRQDNDDFDANGLMGPDMMR